MLLRNQHTAILFLVSVTDYHGFTNHILLLLVSTNHNLFPPVFFDLSGISSQPDRYGSTITVLNKIRQITGKMLLENNVSLRNKILASEFFS